MLQTITRWLGSARKPEPKPTPPTFVYDPPWSDWIEVLAHLHRAEDAVLAYAKRDDLPAGVASSMAHAAEQINVGRWHDTMRLCKTPIDAPHYKPCCSHVADALAAREPDAQTSV